MPTIPVPVLLLTIASLYLLSIHFLLRLLHNRDQLRRP
ncbi:hypothetical protein AM1_4664 [Acaryochloris marina MBIC11017]|uniref:Uncharacterized protein n=1 Tax=Acaryochloris marina (strain MBIC 11017) TaxID=329726 RepID=B0C0E6_ACAM1|nr:hypothetical protein AM1_4664 [Acaryochloris marina MBIC11017]